MAVILHLTDHHFPLENRKAVQFSVEAARELQPDMIVLGGDLFDGYALSRFDKKPDKLLSLQTELDKAGTYIRNLQKASPASEFVWLLGNHEERLEKYLDRKAPELACLRGLRITNLVPVDSVRIVPYGERWRVGPLTFVHGAVVRKVAGASAKAVSEAEGCSIVMGHTHRMGMVLQTRGSEVVHSYEGGCLCDLRPSYLKQSSNWQNGVSVFVVEGKEIQWVPILLSGTPKPSRLPLKMLKALQSIGASSGRRRGTSPRTVTRRKSSKTAKRGKQK